MKLIIGSLSTERVITGELEKLILSSIGNGQQDVAIDISNYVMDLNLYEEVGEFNNNIKKCAAVYIKDKDKISDHIDIENRERKTLDGLIDKDIVDKCIKLLEIDDIEYYNNLKNDTNSYYIFKNRVFRDDKILLVNYKIEVEIEGKTVELRIYSYTQNFEYEINNI
ncbi:hypothetical protein [Clostridium butyricum]